MWWMTWPLDRVHTQYLHQQMERKRPHPHTARCYVTYLLRKPYGPRLVRCVGFREAQQWAWLAWLECGRPAAFSFEVLRLFQIYVQKDAYRAGRPGHNEDPTHLAEEAPPERQWLDLVLDYYETHTATETIARWGLPDTNRVRRWLGRCVPKPGRASGRKRHEVRRKVYVQATCAELVAAGLPRATAWRAARRGWYWQRVDAEAPPPSRNEMFRPPSRSKRQRVYTTLSHRDLMAQGVPETTARDAARRGWYMQQPQ